MCCLYIYDIQIWSLLFRLVTIYRLSYHLNLNRLFHRSYPRHVGKPSPNLKCSHHFFLIDNTLLKQNKYLLSSLFSVRSPIDESSLLQQIHLFSGIKMSIIIKLKKPSSRALNMSKAFLASGAVNAWAPSFCTNSLCRVSVVGIIIHYQYINCHHYVRFRWSIRGLNNSVIIYSDM